jgi:uncharacterized SAM-binding protein YcdF (DUF218 family)
MFYLLSKLLPVLLFPLGLALAASIASALLAWAGRGRAAAVVAAAGAAILYLASLPWASDKLVRGLEGRYSPARSYPECPAIVILGGAGVAKKAPRLYPETNAFGDRLAYGALLFRQGLAPRIVVTGGVFPFYGGTLQSEASINADILRTYFAIDSASILLAEGSRNTREDALSVLEVFGAARLSPEIILVTSAAHMPRACALFRTAGFTVHPAPCDFHADSEAPFGLVRFLPDEGALYQTWYGLHEYIGYAAYKAMGWL